MSNVTQIKDNSAARFQLKAKGKKNAELVLYGTIGDTFWEEGITGKSVVNALNELGNIENLDVRINSMGGDVFEGVTIYNRLKQMDAKVTVYVDGLAASIATIIAMAGDEVILSEGTLFMVHSPMTMAFGNQREFQDKIEILDTIEEEMLGIYARKTGLSRSEIRSLLHAETWMNAEEALEKGFATSVMEEEKMVACSDTTYKMFSKMYKNCPREDIYTDSKAVKEKLKNLNTNIEDFLARK